MTKILIVDYDQLIRDSLSDTLIDNGYEVIQAGDGEEAFELAIEEIPDIILLEVMMPVMDGFEVLRRLRGTPTTEAIPVVFLSAGAVFEGEQDAVRLGVNHYITKPFDPDMLQATVRVALREPVVVTDHSRTAQEVIKPAGLLLPLEEKLGGGIPLGSLTLVEGSSSAGKSVLCQHLAYGALVAGGSVAYLTSEHTVKSLAAQMASIELGVTDHLGSGKLCVFPLQVRDPGDDAGRTLSRLALDIDHLTTKFKVIIVDAVTNLASHIQDNAILSFFSSCQNQRKKGRAIIVVAHSAAVDEKMLDRLGSLSDIHISLRAAKLGTKRMRTMEVIKAQNEKLNNANIFSFEVEPRVGMRILPVPNAKPSVQTDSVE